MARASRALRILTLGVVALVSAVLVAACESDLSSDVEGKECDADGACLPGYACDEESNLCIEQGAVPSCMEGETLCSGRCVIALTKWL